MPKTDIQLFYKYLDKSHCYFEYGSGGSTYQAYIRDNISKIYSVESDIEWQNKLKNITSNSDKINHIYIDINAEPNNWGNPGDLATDEQKQLYSRQITLLADDDKRAIDCVFIDGRFRVACALHTFNTINDDTFVLFDDFIPRRHYHIVMNYYDIIEHASQLVVLKKKKDCIPPSKELIDKYELIHG